MQKWLIGFLCFLMLPTSALASGLQISKIHPKPADGEKSEFIEITNTSCENISLADYSLQVEGKSPKKLQGSIDSHESRKLYRTDTKILLVDSGAKILLKKGDELIDEWLYPKQDKASEEPLTREIILENCEKETPKNDDENGSNSGSITPPPSNSTSPTASDEQNVFPEFLEYVDENEDGFIEGILVYYSDMISGEFSSSDFALQLMSEKSDTPDGEKISLEGAIIKNEDNVLEFDFKNIDKLNTLLSLKNENIRRWRLIADENIKITNPDKKEVLLLDNNSFDGYKNIIFPEIPKNSTSNEDDIFPEIIPVLSGSFLRFENNILYCDNNCHISLNFSSIFSEKFKKDDYACKITIGDENFDMCDFNGDLDEDIDGITFLLEHKNTKKIKYWTAKIEHSIGVNQGFPIIKIHSDGNFQKYYRWLDDENIECFSSPCYVNLNASDSLSADGSKLHFLWDFGNFGTKITKNPPSIAFSTGQYSVNLTVTDAKNRKSQKTIHIFVPKNETKNPKQFRQNNSRQSSQQVKNTVKKDKKSISKPEFVIPKIILQGSKGFENPEEFEYICETKTDFCTINFSLENSQKGYQYRWDWGDGREFFGYNPTAQTVKIGDTILSVSAFDEDNAEDILWEQDILITVVKKIEQEKIAKTKKENNLNAQSHRKNTNKKSINKKRTPKKATKKPPKKTIKKPKKSAQKEKNQKNETKNNTIRKKEIETVQLSKDTTSGMAIPATFGLMGLSGGFLYARKEEFLKSIARLKKPNK